MKPDSEISSRQMRRGWLALCLLVCVGLSRGDVGAQSAGPSPASAGRPASTFRHVYVPASEPDAWPPGDWQAVPRREYLSAREQPRLLQPPTVLLQSMVYRARFSNEALRDGELEGVVRLKSSEPQFLDLGSPSLAIDELVGASGEVVWGTAADGRILLRATEDQEVLRGQWSLAGRKVFSAVEFDVTVPPAVVTRFELEVPEPLLVTAEGGLVSGNSEGDRPGWRVWSIDLGRRTTCRLSVGETTAASRTGSAGIQATQAAEYSFRIDGLHVQADVTLESVEGPVAILDFTVPAGMRFSPVTVGEAVLPVELRTAQNGGQLLSVDVRALALSRGTTVRIRGTLPLRPGRFRPLPRLGLRNARWLSLRKQITVSRPLELQNLSAEGCVLLSSSVSPDAGDAFQFEDYSRSARISVAVDTPRPDLAAKVMSHVDWRREDPLLRCILLLEPISGSTYAVDCRVPAGWDVTKVEAGAATSIAQWAASDDVRGNKRLSIELRTALTPQNPAEIVVWARPVEPLPEQSVDVPVVLPRVSGDRDVSVVIESPPGRGFSSERDSAYQPIGISRVLEDWKDRLPPRLAQVAPAGVLSFQAEDPAEEARLLIDAGSSAAVSERAVEVADATLLAPGDGEFAAVDIPPVAAMAIQTSVAVEGGRLCRNRVVLKFAATHRPRSFAMRLPRGVRIIDARVVESATGAPCGLAWIDGFQIDLSLPVSETPCDVVLRYETPLNVAVISGEATIPLPEWEGVTTMQSWEIELPAGYRLRASTDGSSVQAAPRLSWSQRLLGPLGDAGDGPRFWPFSGGAWRRLIAGEGTAAGSPANAALGTRGIVLRSLPGTQTALRIAFWNPTAANHVGWTVLLVSLLLFAWPHHHQQRLLSLRWSVAVVFVGIVGALLAPEFLAIPWGGFVAGAVLGMLLPEDCLRPPRGRWRARGRDALRSTHLVRPRPATWVRLVLVMTVCAGSTRGWQTSPSARSGAFRVATSVTPAKRVDVLVPVDGKPGASQQMPAFVYMERASAQSLLSEDRPEAPHYLIRAAEYEVTDFDEESPRLTARFEVLVLSRAEAIDVVMPLTNVVFENALACRVDGVVVPVLPHSSGEGIVVQVSPADDTRDPEFEPTEDSEKDSVEAIASATRVRAVQIELVCRQRPGLLEDGPRLDLGIPGVVNARAAFRIGRPQRSDIAMTHLGAATLQPGEKWQRAALGGLRELVAHPAEEGLSQHWLAPLSAVSVIEAHPLRLQVESVLTFDVDPRRERLASGSIRLRLPPHAVVRDVRAPGLERRRLASAVRGQVDLHLSFARLPDDPISIALSFDLPTPAADAAVVTIPALPFLPEDAGAAFPVHSIGIAAEPGFRILANDPEGMVAGATGIDESLLPEWRGPRRARAADATFRLSVPRPIELPLAAIEPQVSAVILQQLAVREARIGWTASIDAVVSDAAVAVHRLVLDPRLQVRQASVQQDGVERLARWTQSRPEELMLFLSDEVSGRYTIRLSGALMVEDRRHFEVPAISLDGAALVEPSAVEVSHAEDLMVVRLSRPGSDGEGRAETAKPVTGSIPLAEGEGPPVLGVRRARHAVHVAQASVIPSGAGAEPTWICYLHITSDELLPPSLSVDVRAPGEQFEWETSVPIAESATHEDGSVTLRFEDVSPQPSVVDVALRSTARSVPSHQLTLPEVRIAGELATPHFVITGAAASELPIAAGCKAADGELPPWLVERLGERRPGDWQVWTCAARPGAWQPAAEQSAATALRHLGSALWQRSDGLWSGVTVADVVAHQGGEVPFQVPEGVQVRQAQVDGQPVHPDAAGNVSFPLSSGTPLQRCALWWEVASHRGPADVPLPYPVETASEFTDVVLLGQRERHYELGPSAGRVIDPAEELRDLESAADSTADVSPIAAALRAAGVGATRDAAETASEMGGTVIAVRIPGVAQELSVRTLDRQMIRLTGLISAAVLALLAWAVLGRWIDPRRMPRGPLSASGMAWLLMAGAIWMWGASPAGFVLLLVGLSFLVRDVRRSTRQSDGQPADSSVAPAG